jgi:hypothetical protein
MQIIAPTTVTKSAYYGDEYNVYSGKLTLTVTIAGTFVVALYSAQNGAQTRVEEKRIFVAPGTYDTEFADVPGRLLASLVPLNGGKASLDVTITITGKDDVSTLSLAATLASAPAVGTVAYPTDAPGARLVLTAGGWAGDLGFLATSSALDAVDTTDLVGGMVKAYVVDVGFAALSADKSKWLYSLVAELPE